MFKPNQKVKLVTNSGTIDKVVHFVTRSYVCLVGGDELFYMSTGHSTHNLDHLVGDRFIVA